MQVLLSWLKHKLLPKRHSSRKLSLSDMQPSLMTDGSIAMSCRVGPGLVGSCIVAAAAAALY